MRSDAIDLTGQQCGRWTVLSPGKSQGRGERYWTCRCECGTIREVRGNGLRDGTSRSCGCLTRDEAAARCARHNMASSPEYRAWAGAKYRCQNSKNPSYRHYGARGITMCDRWSESFEAFLVDMGRRPSPQHSIDRINNDGNYEPGNCRWATREEQNNNLRRTQATGDALRRAWAEGRRIFKGQARAADGTFAPAS